MQRFITDCDGKTTVKIRQRKPQTLQNKEMTLVLVSMCVCSVLELT